VAASGLLLLRLADPRNLTKTLPVFSIKQLMLQPILSGGIITVVAPLAVARLGLLGWTELCGVVTVVFIGLAIVIKISSSSVSTGKS
ncbi:MAG TPA: sodium:solute symporter, partial [Prochlorococcus sp.]